MNEKNQPFKDAIKSYLDRRAAEGNPEAKRLLGLSDGLMAELERRKLDRIKEDLERFYAKEDERKAL